MYAEVIHEKNILISAKDKFLNNTREELDETKRVAECRLRAIKELEEELDETKRVAECRLRAIKELEEEIRKLKEENEKLKKFEAASTEVKKIMDDIRGGK